MAEGTAERLLFEPENKIYHCTAITSRPHLLYPSVIKYVFLPTQRECAVCGWHDKDIPHQYAHFLSLLLQLCHLCFLV